MSGLPVILPQTTKIPFNGFGKLSMTELAISRQLTPDICLLC
jgi:hypothetical protein